MHRERNVRVAAERVAPRPEPVHDGAGLSVAKRHGHGRVDVGSDTKLGVGRPPRSGAIHECDLRGGPRCHELGSETLADRRRLQRTDVDSADGHPGESTLRVSRVHREAGAYGKRDRRERGNSEHPDATTRRALLLAASRENRHAD
ncbi:MAG: hypothetical protein AUH39_02065 [Chloroflexi bacterium 13_1_40CM_67_9]|nr:MAG: hypothetical protein AUH39_02065 [Chloroflexi bacterium 13_1_40CM_67_9]